LDFLRSLSDHGLELAVVSNFDERLHGLLDDFGISEFVSRAFISAEVGFQKPEAEIFNILLAHFRVSDPKLCLHVGDNYKKDYLPAKTLGMHALLLKECDPNVPPADCIRSISELNKL
jgi:putative hydrolase of the HAD superfamily